MASTSFDSSATGTSSFLREIADFDINGPISVTIHFEDDFDEQSIKTETETDDNQKEPPTIDNSAFVPILEPKKEVQDKELVSCPLIDEFSHRVIVQNKFQKTVHQPESTLNKCTPQKRKSNEYEQNDLQPSTSTSNPNTNAETPKKSRYVVGDEKNLEIGNSLQITHVNENKGQINSTSPAKRKEDIRNCGESHSSPFEVPEKQLNACIINCLATISDQMRCIMEAYDFHKQYKTPKETFKDIKLNYFKSSLKYVYTIILPEEKNVNFIQTFLNDTVQKARKAAGPNHSRSFQDYANLLFEMLMWVKQTTQLIPRAVQIENEPPKTNSTNPSSQLSATVQCPKEFGTKSQSVTQTDVLQTSKLVATQSQQQLPISSTKAPVNYNIASASQQANPRASMLQMQLDMPPILPSVVLHQQIQPQQQKSQRPPPPPYGILPHQQAKYDQIRYSQMQMGQQAQPPTQYGQANLSQTQVTPPPFDPLRSLENQFGQNQRIPPQYNQAQKVLKQNTPMHHQSGPSFIQQGQTPQHLAQYGQTRLPQINQQQRPVERFPSVAALLSQDSPLLSTPSITNKGGPWENVQPQNGQSNYSNHLNFGSTYYMNQTYDKAQCGQWHSQNLDAQQIQPRLAPRPEWHQELNAMYQAGAPSQTQKGSPRAASTDSGFISPLNFNTSADQTMSAPPEEPETTLPLITHVTSLNEKAAFIEYGNCVVCKKSTKQMCMGCMKIYYCTYQCQSQDWSAHASYCMQQTTNHGSAQPH